MNVIRLGRFLLIFLSISLFLSCKAQEGQVKRSKQTEIINGRKYYIHKVDKGQTLYSIARAYSIEVNDLVAENPDAIDGIKPGQELKIPADKPKSKGEAGKTPTDTSKYTYHKVATGQTLYSLSKLYNISIDAIIAANPGTSTGVKVGQEIKIPKQGTISVNSAKSLNASVDSLPLLDSVAAYRAVYNVALFLPFHSELSSTIDVDKIVNGEEEFPQKSTFAVEFYNGIKAAADSLSKKGLSLKLFLYDIDESDSIKISRILQKPELQTMNLIIGPLYSNNFVNISAFAKEKKIQIVSPLTTQNKILFNNIYVSKITPSITTQMDQMAEYISKNFSKENIVLVNTPSVKDSGFVNSFRTKIKEDLGAIPFYNDSIKEIRSAEGISSVLSREKQNIIVLPSNGQINVTNILTQLNTLKDRYKISVFGMQSWMNFENLDPEYLNTLNVHLPVASFIDYENDTTEAFISSYRKVYFTDPDNFAFQGYDVGTYYFKGLLESGLNFGSYLSGRKFKGLQISYFFKRITPDSGLENTSVYFVRYEDYKLIKVN